MWENSLVQDRDPDVKLEVQEAAKLNVDFGPTTFLRNCTDRQTQTKNRLERNTQTYFFVLLCRFPKKRVLLLKATYKYPFKKTF